MLVIRFARTGKKKQAYFRVVVAEKERAVGAKFVEILGNYDPHAKKLAIDKDRLAFYLKNGAQPSNTVAKLLAKEKFELPKWVKITEKKPARPKSEDVDGKAPSNSASSEAPLDKSESTEGEVAPEATEEASEEAPAEATEESAEEAGEAPEESNSASNEAPLDEQKEKAAEETVETSEEDNK